MRIARRAQSIVWITVKYKTCRSPQEAAAGKMSAPVGGWLPSFTFRDFIGVRAAGQKAVSMISTGLACRTLRLQVFRCGQPPSSGLQQPDEGQVPFLSKLVRPAFGVFRKIAMSQNLPRSATGLPHAPRFKKHGD
jgi:hypothetical protein